MNRENKDSSGKNPTYYIIHEVYDNFFAHQHFEAQLEKALEAKVDYILIGPSRLGDETGRWISMGNCLHKMAVISGLASLSSSILWPHRLLMSGPLCVISVFCTGLYTVSWNFDPCCQYQVKNDDEELEKLQIDRSSSPVILGYSSNKTTKYIHRSVTFLSVVFCAWQIWRSYK